MLVDNKYISPHNYDVEYFKSKLAVEVPSCRIFSVVLGLPRPPINITPAGESQLQRAYLIIIIISNTELTRTVRDISDNGSLNIIISFLSLFIFISQITSSLAV